MNDRPAGEGPFPPAKSTSLGLRKKAQRYQKGSRSQQKLKSQPSIWTYRYYTEENGKRVYKKVRIGSVVELPKRKDAEKAIAQLRIDCA